MIRGRRTCDDLPVAGMPQVTPNLTTELRDVAGVDALSILYTFVVNALASSYDHSGALVVGQWSRSFGSSVGYLSAATAPATLLVRADW